MTVCQRCNSRLTFICQIYCPVDEKPEAFHRMLYIYACLKGKCKDSTEAVRVFRCQLPQENRYYSKNPPNYDLLDMSDSALAQKQKDVLDAINQNEKQYTEASKIQGEGKKLSSVYMLEIDNEAEKITKRVLRRLTLLEKGEEDSDEYDSDDSQIMSQSDKELLAKYEEEEKDEFQTELSKQFCYSHFY